MSEPVFSGINHIGIVTGDIDRAVRIWSDRYGIGPWRLFTKDASNMTALVDGKPAGYAMRVALAQLSPASRVEIIQPLDERNPYAASLAKHGGADHIHHVRFDVVDYAATTERLSKLGLQTSMNADFNGAPGTTPVFSCRYFSTGEDLGFISEIGSAAEGFTMPEPDAVYPPILEPVDV